MRGRLSMTWCLRGFHILCENLLVYVNRVYEEESVGGGIEEVSLYYRSVPFDASFRDFVSFLCHTYWSTLLIEQN